MCFFSSLMHFSWDDPEDPNWSDRRRRIANCQTVMWCWRSNLPPAVEPEKVRRVGGVAIYCEILKLHKLCPTSSPVRKWAMHLHFVQFPAKNHRNPNWIPEKKETKSMQVPLRLSPWQLSIWDWKINKKNLPFPVGEKVFCFPHLIAKGFQLAEQVIF